MEQLLSAPFIALLPHNRIRCCSPPSVVRIFTGFRGRTRIAICAARMCCARIRIPALTRRVAGRAWREPPAGIAQRGNPRRFEWIARENPIAPAGAVTRREDEVNPFLADENDIASPDHISSNPSESGELC
jgi:hypothetical protein